MSKARNIDYVMHYTEWDLAHEIRLHDTFDKTQTGKRILKRMVRLLDDAGD